MKKTEIIMLESDASKQQWRVSCHDMWQDIFGDSDDYMGYYEEFKWPENRVLLLAEGKRLCSMLHLNPYRIRQGDRERELHYIVGVCTRRDRRRRGYMAALLGQAFRFLYDRGDVWTYLMPAAQEIYRPFGFRPVFWAEPAEESMPAGEGMSGQGLPTGRVFSYEECSDGEKRALERFAAACLSEHFGIYTVHDTEYFRERSREMKACGGELLLLEYEGEIIGYTEYMYDVEEEIPLEVAETVLADENRETGYRMIREYLLGRYGQAELHVLFSESAFLPESHPVQGGAEPGSGRKYYSPKCQIMARVLDFRRAAEEMRRPDGWGECVCCRITDSCVEENNGNWELRFGEKENIVRRTQDFPAFCLDMGEFTELYFQGKSLYINEMV